MRNFGEHESINNISLSGRKGRDQKDNHKGAEIPRIGWTG
jgi:hypothetical protein